MSDVFLTDSSNNTYDVMYGDLLFPYYGNWSSHITLAEAQTAPTGQVTLSWLNTKLTGYVLRSGDNEGRVSCLIVGGKGGLWKHVSAKMYDYQLKVQLPLQEILAAAGESLSSTSSVATLGLQLPNWTRFDGTASDLLNALTDKAGALWRVLPDGTIFVGTDTWLQESSFDGTLLWQDPTWATATFAVPFLAVLPGGRFPASPLPISNRKIGCCRYQIDPTYSRATLWFAEEDGTFIDDAMHAGLVSIVRQTMRFVDYHATYTAKVLTQRSQDGTLDVVPDDRRLPPMTSVPVRVPVPGASIVVPDGSRVLIVFENGDPTKYAAQLYQMGDGTRNIARKDDEVDCGALKFITAGMGVLTGEYTDPAGTVIPFSLGTPISLKGKIKNGWPHFKVGSEDV